MISDVLYQAVVEIDEYLDDDREIYSGTFRVRVIRLRNEMAAMRSVLDSATSVVPDDPDIPLPRASDDRKEDS